jgi:hypothetical protein
VLQVMLIGHLLLKPSWGPEPDNVIQISFKAADGHPLRVSHVPEAKRIIYRHQERDSSPHA